ncbi:hypothetical protein BGY98DRAFT_350386 [Russula aff. rugulosa BPL654]|nr:hypothetical protein BGY98DRAFT_350386 [Russula aff. rugulosa BPL654]
MSSLASAALYLLCRREKTVTTVVMMILTVVMFGISATLFSLETYLFSDGLLHPYKYPRTVIDFYGPVATAQIILQGINTILGDSIVIWRAYVVWGRRLSVVIVPIVLLVGVGFSSFAGAFAHSRAFYEPKYATAFEKTMIALPSLTLATNVVATCLVLSRIFALHIMVRRAERLDRLSSLIGQGGTRYRRLLKMLIESGGMYCLTWLILLCLIITGSMAEHVFLAIIGQLTGIYPTLIIVLVSLNLAQDRDTQGPVDTGLKFSSSTVNGPTRTVSFSLAHAPSSSAAIVNKGDVESGGIELAAEARSGRVTDVS